MRSPLLTLALTVFLSIPAARAEDWPEFRGPTGQGVAPGRLPTEWGPTKNIAWKQAIPGRGWSSPVVAKGRVYLTTAVLAEDGSKDVSLRGLCLDARSGNILWNTEVFRHNSAKIPAYYDKGSYASPTPLIDGRRLYAVFGHLGAAALDLDGKILWRNSDLSFSPGFGSNASSPVLIDDALILSCDGIDKQFVAALDRATGKKLLWKIQRSKTDELNGNKRYAFTTPLLIEVKGKKQIVSPGAGAVYAYDPETGAELWRVHYGDGYAVAPRPVFGHGLVFVCSGYDIPTLLAIRPDGRGDVTSTHVAWTARKGVPLIASPLLVGDELYLASTLGLASCLDAKTGKVHWQERIGGVFYASPLAADGKVYFQNEEGLGTVVKASTKFEVAEKNAMGEPTLASLGAADGALFLRTEKSLYCIAEGPAARPARAEPKPAVKETMLFDFEEDEAVKAWSNLAASDPKGKEPEVKTERSREHATSNKYSMKLTFSGGRFPTVTTPCPIADWTGFKAFKADVTASRPCVVVFRALHEKSTRGASYNDGVGRWEYAALLKPGRNEVVALLPTGKEYAKVTTFDLFPIDPHEGEAIFVDNVRLSPEAPTATTPLHIDYVYSPGQDHPSWPNLEKKIAVLGNDFEVANVNELGDKLKAQWVKPEDRTVEQIEAEVKAQFEELKKKHPGAVLAVLRDGARGYDPAAPDKVYNGWKDCGTTAHPPTSLTVASLRNVGKAETMETVFRLRPALMRVDLSSIPPGAQVLAARLLLVRAHPLAKDWDAKPTLFVAEPCNRPWQEFEMNSFEYAKDKFWKETWGMSWTGADPDFFPLFLAHGPSQGTANTWDFTRAVNYWIDGKHPNHGFALYAAPRYIDYLWVHTRKAKEVRNRPTLFVIYR
jgi:outer membrane protein assembly factor BamB